MALPSGMELDHGSPLIDAIESAAAFEDVFLAQDALDPTLQAMIDDDRDEDTGEYDWMLSRPADLNARALRRGRGWNADEDKMEFGPAGDLVACEDASSSEGSQSGYETDEGETTEEETPVALPSRSTSRSQTPAQAAYGTVTPTNPRQRSCTIISARKSKNGPPVGMFKCDTTKPYALVDGSGKALLIFSPQKKPEQRSQSFNPSKARDGSLPAGGFGSSTAVRMGHPLREVQTSPAAQFALHDASPIYDSRTTITSLISSSPNPILSGLVTPTAGLSLQAMAGEIVGPPEAFYPFIGVSTIGNPFSDDEEETMHDDEMMDLDEFIDFTAAESETEGDSDMVRQMITGQSQSRSSSTSTVRGNTTSNNDAKWFEHLSKRGLTNAFRRDQNIKKNLHARRSRAFTMLPPVINHKKAIKPGRHSIVMSPVSPLQKRGPPNPWTSGIKKRPNGAAAVKRKHMPMPLQAAGPSYRHRRVQTSFY